MKIEITIDERQLSEMVCEHLRKKLGDIEIDQADVEIQVKSKQNWRAEWEKAQYRAVYKKG